MYIKKLLIFTILFTGLIQISYGQIVKNKTIIIQVNKPVAVIQPTMWGVFFEDINLGADGGIYAELVKNRSFEFYKPLMGWNVKENKPTLSPPAHNPFP